MSHFDDQDPFTEMRSPITPLIGPDEAAAQRTRVVARLQRLQESAQARRVTARVTWKRLSGVCAAVATMAVITCAYAFYGDGGKAPVPVTAPVVETGAPGFAAAKVDAPPPAESAAPVAAAADVRSSAPAAPSRRHPSSSEGTRSPVEHGSTLGEENALLQHAMAASRSGDAERAVSLLDEHLKRYPRSTLARNAELERMRGLERSGNLASARAAARRYLARYPDGMGSDEARRIAMGARSPDSRPLSAP